MMGRIERSKTARGKRVTALRRRVLEARRVRPLRERLRAAQLREPFRATRVNERYLATIGRVLGVQLHDDLLNEDEMDVKDFVDCVRFALERRAAQGRGDDPQSPTMQRWRLQLLRYEDRVLGECVPAWRRRRLAELLAPYDRTTTCRRHGNARFTLDNAAKNHELVPCK